ncbi:MAG TPA: FadR/GntR family transcriptional regulator [Chloroflexota bacterium]|nr:FadR/GntR family transcriptional regulator [Chloroflexota bacterium]
MQSPRILKTRIYEQIVLQLQQEILSGRLAAGDRLPPERELALRFRVSRASIREALSVLQSRGFIESRQGGGTIIRPTPDTMVTAPLDEQLARHGDEVRNPLEVRYIFEPQTAYLAAERATDEEVAVIRNLLAAQEAAIAGGGTGLEQDTAFHLAIAEAAHNDLLVTIVNYINHAIRETREWSLRARSGTTNSVAHHHHILTAIAGHKPEAAQTAMAEHLEDVQMMALRWLRERAADLGSDHDRRPLLARTQTAGREAVESE